jgi:hypothetical protein
MRKLIGLLGPPQPRAAYGASMIGSLPVETTQIR